ncbi:reverse transcriptase domain-containing protein [Tanacetum coccineum]
MPRRGRRLLRWGSSSSRICFIVIDQRSREPRSRSSVQIGKTLCHNGPTGGHHGANLSHKKVLTPVSSGTTIDKVAHEFVKNCDSCNVKEKTSNVMGCLKTQSKFVKSLTLGIDFYGTFPSSRLGNKYILGAVLFGTKWVEAKALPPMTCARSLQIFEISFARFGAPVCNNK